MKKKKKKKPLLSMTNELYSSIAKPMKYRVKKKIVPISYLLDFFFLLKAKVKFSLSLSLSLSTFFMK